VAREVLGEPNQSISPPVLSQDGGGENMSLGTGAEAEHGSRVSALTQHVSVPASRQESNTRPPGIPAGAWLSWK
jgi:hypothetical protein